MHVLRAAVLALIKFINFIDSILQAVGIKLCKFTRDNVLRGKSVIMYKSKIRYMSILFGLAKGAGVKKLR